VPAAGSVGTSVSDLGTPPAGPSFDALALGQPVDRNVAASNLGSLGSRPNAPVADRFASLPDLNALPATGAGPSDLTGFPVARVSLADALQVSAGGDPSGFMIGGQRLFVYHGIPDMLLLGDGTGSLRIPQDAFAHTDPLAIVHLEAHLINGLPLPSWLKFEGIGGSFRGVPPADQLEPLEIEVVARDPDGREARTKFGIDIEALRASQRQQVGDLPDIMLGLDVDAKEAERLRLKAKAEKAAPKGQAEKARLEAARNAIDVRTTDKSKPGIDGKPQRAPAASFTDQVRAAKGVRDPLLDLIARSGPDKPGPRR
jgi:hypothetical protein